MTRISSNSPSSVVSLLAANLSSTGRGNGMLKEVVQLSIRALTSAFSLHRNAVLYHEPHCHGIISPTPIPARTSLNYPERFLLKS